MQTGFFHHVGTFLLFVASILLLVTTISAPVVAPIGLLKVDLGNGSTVSFGSFGYCILNVAPVNSGQNWCSPKSIGYEPATVMSDIDATDFSDASSSTANRLTKVMILHPIACGVAFIAFLLAFGAGCCGSFLGALVSAVAWMISVVVLATDFATFAIIKKNVNDFSTDATFSYASYSTAIWTILVAMLCLFFGAIIVFFTCCSGRMHRRSNNGGKMGASYVPPPMGRPFWRRGY